jgi:Arc/MetJ-type ribon-helix-helix transcriptional regulator
MARAKTEKKASGRGKAKQVKSADQLEVFMANAKDKLKKAKARIVCAVEGSGITEHLRKAIDSVCSCVRGNVIMVRVDAETLKRLEELVEVGLFKSKSDSAAFLIMEGVKAQKSVFDKISKKATEISELRKELKQMIGLA